YGEALLALLEAVWEEHGPKIRAVGRVELKIASRKQDELVGYDEPDKYHRKLEALIAHACRQAGWPKKLRVHTRDAKFDAHLILADFYAGDVPTAAWAHDLAERVAPSTRRVMAMA